MIAREIVMPAGLARGRVGPARWPLFLRWAGLVALLVAEVIGLTLRFDGKALADLGGIWGALLGHSHWLPRVGLTMALSTLVLGGTRLLDGLAVAAAGRGRPHRWSLPLAGHLAAFGVLIWLTWRILETDLGESASPDRLALAWLGVAALTAALWAAAALPPAIWMAEAGRNAGLIGVATALGFAAWGAGWLSAGSWRTLGRSTLLAVHFLLGLAYRETVFDPAVQAVGTPTFWVHVAPECSGSEGIGLIAATVVAFLWFYRRELRFPRALLLLPLGVALIAGFNVLRIVALVVIGTSGAPGVAVGGFHSQAGWLAFNVVALGLIGLATSVRSFWKAPAPARPEEATDEGGANAYLAPMFTLIAAMMIGRACSDGFDWLYALRPVAVVAVLWHYRRRYAEIRPRWSWPSAAIGVAAFAIWMALRPAPAGDDPGAATASGLAGLPGVWAVAWLAFRVIGSVLTVPMAEELAFRGYLARRLVAADFEDVSPRRLSWPSALISSALFGALHGAWLAGTLAGLLYAAAYARRGSLADAILAHAITNGLLTALVLATGDWSLWS